MRIHAQDPPPPQVAGRALDGFALDGAPDGSTISVAVYDLEDCIAVVQTSTVVRGGRAVFEGLVVRAPGTYRLRAMLVHHDSMVVESAPFCVVAGPAVALRSVGGVASLVDACGNVILDREGTTVEAHFRDGTIRRPLRGGYADFSDLGDVELVAEDARGRRITVRASRALPAATASQLEHRLRHATAISERLEALALREESRAAKSEAAYRQLLSGGSGADARVVDELHAEFLRLRRCLAKAKTKSKQRLLDDWLRPATPRLEAVRAADERERGAMKKVRGSDLSAPPLLADLERCLAAEYEKILSSSSSSYSDGAAEALRRDIARVATEERARLEALARDVVVPAYRSLSTRFAYLSSIRPVALDEEWPAHRYARRRLAALVSELNRARRVADLGLERDLYPLDLDPRLAVAPGAWAQLGDDAVLFQDPYCVAVFYEAVRRREPRRVAVTRNAWWSSNSHEACSPSPLFQDRSEEPLVVMLRYHNLDLRLELRDLACLRARLDALARCYLCVPDDDDDDESGSI